MREPDSCVKAVLIGLGVGAAIFALGLILMSAGVVERRDGLANLVLTGIEGMMAK